MSVKSRIRGAYSLVRRVAEGRQDRRKAERELVRASDLFDRDWYLRKYPDVRTAGVDPLLHYMNIGWQEGRDPGPGFSSSAYLRTNADVARSGTNPLVHFIEFGHSEGRETFGHRPKAEYAPIKSFDFPEPSPCFSSALPVSKVPAWIRHYRLHEGRSDLCAIGDEAVGYATDADARAAFEAAVACLQQISGYGDQCLATDFWNLPHTDEKLVDAWYANAARLRTRWDGKYLPFVIRAYQADPVANGTISLVAEGLVSSPLDVLDLHLKNAYFPILLVLVEPDGIIRGAQLLAFPSLCRGGAHYSELLQTGRNSDNILEPLAYGERLAGRLAQLVAARAHPAVRSLSVELDGADGARPLFQPDFQIWLEKVARVRVQPCGEGDGSLLQRFLADAVTVEPSIGRAGDGATLVLQHDMIPTLAALIEKLGERDGADDQILLPLLLAGADPAWPAISIELPSDMIPVMDAFAWAGSAKWPRLKMGRGGVRRHGLSAGAIKVHHTEGLTDAELFFPVSSHEPARGAGQREGITWLIESHHWDDGQLLLAMVAAAQQSGADADAVAFIGPVAPRTIEVAAQSFGARVKRFADFDSAVAGVSTVLSGYIGSGVILHDNSCATALSRLVEFDSVATASCVLISVEPRGKTWHAAIAQGGALAMRNGNHLTSQANVRATEQLWRTIYPVAAPSPRFWLAKSSRLKSWSDGGPQSGSEGVHICSSVVTASFMAYPPPSKSPSFIPKARENGVAATEVLFG